MVEGFFHQVSIQLEKDEKSTILPKKKSRLPAVVKIINDIFKVEKLKVIIVSGYFT